jgi:hypothetical protein
VRLLDADLTGEEVVGQVILDPERLADKRRGRTLPTVVHLEDGETTLKLDLTWEEAHS